MQIGAWQSDCKSITRPDRRPDRRVGTQHRHRHGCHWSQRRHPGLPLAGSVRHRHRRRPGQTRPIGQNPNAKFASCQHLPSLDPGTHLTGHHATTGLAGFYCIFTPGTPRLSPEFSPTVFLNAHHGPCPPKAMQSSVPMSGARRGGISPVPRLASAYPKKFLMRFQSLARSPDYTGRAHRPIGRAYETGLRCTR